MTAERLQEALNLSYASLAGCQSTSLPRGGKEAAAEDGVTPLTRLQMEVRHQLQ